jgi:tripartite-type tricarboxylate transporter receptor subunit TctC
MSKIFTAPRRLKQASYAFVAIAFMATFTAGAVETNWPTRPVTVIVPAAAGGGADVLTRIVTGHLTKLSGQSFIIDNKPGAAGGIGLSQLKRAARDGYTVAYGNLNTMAINPSLFAKLPYDPQKDFELAGALFTVPNLLVVRADSPYKTVSDLIAAAKAAQGKMFWGAGNLGSSGHMGGELFKRIGNFDATYVPYNGDPASLTDLIGGHLAYTITNAPVAWSMVQGGKLRALAITTAQRMPALPAIPTMDESGLKGYDSSAWGGMFFPVGTPKPIVDRLTALLDQTMKSEEVRTELARQFATPTTSSKTEFATYIASEQKKWADVIEKAQIEKQ